MAQKKGKKKRREIKYNTRRLKQSILNTDPSEETIPNKLLSHPWLDAEPDLNLQ